jgi:hypothetical protein
MATSLSQPEDAANPIRGKRRGVAMGIPLEQWNGSDATKQLEETIKRAQLENSKQQATMLSTGRCSLRVSRLSLLS